MSFVAVEAFQDTERAKKLIKEKNLNFILLEDSVIDGEKIYQKYGVSAFPSNFIFNKKGKLAYFHLGFGEGMQNKILEEILKELNE